MRKSSNSKTSVEGSQREERILKPQLVKRLYVAREKLN